MSLFEKAIKAIDDYNQGDPNSEIENNTSYPKAYLDSIRQTKWLNRLNPNASEALQIAARSQHIGRWEISRDTYPKTRTGYLQWRTDLGKYHAEKSAQILAEIGFEETTIERVKSLNQKKNIKLDQDSQTIEDVLCLVFLEYHIESFAAEHPDKEKLINIVQKTWKKMSDKGRAEALKLSYTPHVGELLKEALL